MPAADPDPVSPREPVAAHRPATAVPVLAAGVVAALHVGKLPPALPAIRDTLQMELVTAGFLVALFQLGSAMIGIMGGALADRFGPRRIQVTGLVLLGLASIGGAGAASPAAALAWRAVESVAFIMSVLPGPSLIARAVGPRAISGWLGLWGAYMPIGFATALLVMPWLLADWGWRTSWVLIGLVSFASAAAILLRVPADGPRTSPSVALGPLLRATIRRPGPWLLSLCFGFYAGQFISIFGFLPTIYEEAGVDPGVVGALTAVAVAVNAIGNIAAGRLMHRGASPAALIAFTAIVMIACEWLAFGSDAGFGVRYAAVVVLSLVAGLIPGTLFACVPRHAPGLQAVGTTVGLVQQGAGIGQLLAPPLVAWVAAASGGWSHTWIVTGALSVVVLVIAGLLAAYERRTVTG
ncbi:MAG: MFS transporter [Burkholderiaceae bacterium]